MDMNSEVEDMVRKLRTRLLVMRYDKLEHKQTDLTAEVVMQMVKWVMATQEVCEKHLDCDPDLVLRDIAEVVADRCGYDIQRKRETQAV